MCYKIIKLTGKYAISVDNQQKSLNDIYNNNYFINFLHASD
ncbi:hypothetical protein CANDROIZ_270003 [Candidatus Roizmanbacteria bacterium]|nr:hypothetical protein CANDROIZ_270003 [Candidatus Roizmanbacteria bacterium]